MNYSSAPALGGAFWVFMIVYLAAIIFLAIVPTWKMFTKAGKPGWGSIVPIYNAYLMLKICSRPGWWLLLLFIPLVNFVVLIILCIDLAKTFGKGAGFAVGLILLSFIFVPILGYGNAQYTAIQR